MKEATLTPTEKIHYPESDGEPMASNTVQFKCIVSVEGNIEVIFLNDPNVFIAGDFFWYPVEGRPDIRQAPDAMVVFGRPKGHRGSYLQWKEDNIAPQVVFEIVSPGNRAAEWVTKFLFYQRYGVEEYYIYDPDTGTWDGWLRQGEELVQIENMVGWVSPRLGIRFERGFEENVGLYYPDGRPFLGFEEFAQKAEQERQRADEERQRADEERQRADEERQRADEERQRADAVLQDLEVQRQRAEQLAQRLREMGIEAE